MTSDVVLVLTTVPVGDEGEAIARALVDERLAACVNLLPPMTSIYHWEGQVESATEHQLIIKTRRHLLDAVRTRLTTLHSYSLPEFLVLEATGSSAYLDWVRGSTLPDSQD